MKQRYEFSDFDELRKTFIAADQSLIYLKDENLNYVFVNRALEQFLNKTSDEIIGLSVFHVIDEDYAVLSNQADLQVLKTKHMQESEINWSGKILQSTKFPVKLPNGKIGVGAYIRDVTDAYHKKQELEQLNSRLREKEENLQLILDSTYEAIFGIDKEGKCTFCNNSCLKQLGYERTEELIGKNMHWLIHYKDRNDTTIDIKDCRIMTAFSMGKGLHAADEIFWRSDGTSFDVEYFSYPQLKNGEIIGLVVTFLNISDRIKSENEIRYLFYHDSLTDLYNRRYMEEQRTEFDTKDQLPLSVILGDVNGLKLTNDIFGHEEGDRLLRMTAGILKEVARKEDIIIRLGGDEFLLILPRINKEQAGQIAKNIREKFLEIKNESIHYSVSLGYDTKTSMEEELDLIIKNADEMMYSEKALDRKDFGSQAVKDILRTLQDKCPWEKEHASQVQNLCTEFGKYIKLTGSELRRLKDAAYHHDIGKIIIPTTLLNQSGTLNKQDQFKIRQHAATGYRILNLSADTMDIAKYVLHHHERWDGGGYPKHLKGDTIPKLSRIIALAESYDCMVHGTPYRQAMGREEAWEEIRKNSGSQFDPGLAERFLDMLRKQATIKP